jgi:hypothetical protein
MARHRQWKPEWADPQLERRELLSQDALPVRSASLEGVPVPRVNLFHHDGINGLVLGEHFVNRLNDRLGFSQVQATRVNQALQAFSAAYARLPVGLPPNGSSPTLASLLATLKQQVSFALTEREVTVTQQRPSLQDAPLASPLASVALIPFALGQIDQAGAALAQLPPVAGPNGTLVPGDPVPILNVASNAILNALAETTIHPTLFVDPADFYLNPAASFDITFTGIPASSAPGFFIRGPGGAILPGATLHPHVPLA